MNRRSFLQRLAYGTVATAALVSLPASLIKAAGLLEAGNHWAIERLQREWVAYYTAHGAYPGAFRVGPELFTLYASELTACERSCATDDRGDRTPTLMFKSALVYTGTQYVTASEVRPIRAYDVQATSASAWRESASGRRGRRR